MRFTIIAALLAAAALPALAQTASPRADARSTASAQVENKARSETPAATRDRVKAAKAQKKKDRQLARQKADSQKKAPAS